MLQHRDKWRPLSKLNAQKELLEIINYANFTEMKYETIKRTYDITHTIRIWRLKKNVKPSGPEDRLTSRLTGEVNEDGIRLLDSKMQSKKTVKQNFQGTLGT